MLDLAAAGVDGRDDGLRPLCVDERAHALGACFAADRVQLIGVEAHRAAAVAGAARENDLHEIGAVALQAAHLFAQIGGRHRQHALAGDDAAAGDLPKRREQPRPRHAIGGDIFAQPRVERAADALHGRESGQQRDARVLCDGRVALRRGLGLEAGASAEGSVRTEVPVEMDVHVDETRQQRHRTEVVRVRPRPMIDGRDAPVLDLDGRVSHRRTATVEQPRGVNRRARGLRWRGLQVGRVFRPGAHCGNGDDGYRQGDQLAVRTPATGQPAGPAFGSRHRES